MPIRDAAKDSAVQLKSFNTIVQYKRPQSASETARRAIPPHLTPISPRSLLTILVDRGRREIQPNHAANEMVWPL